MRSERHAKREYLSACRSVVGLPAWHATPPGYRKTPPRGGRVATLILVVLWCVSCGGTGHGRSVPGEVRDLVFERSDFARPITLEFSREDSRVQYKELQTTYYGLAPIVYPYYTNSDKHLVAYLMANGYATVDTVTQKAQWGGGRHLKFLFYTEKFRSFPRISLATNRAPIVSAGSRVLDSVDYSNAYTAKPLGFPIKFHALTFTYHLEGTLPGLPPIERSFHGKAKAYNDPDDGLWKLESLELEDRGEDEYMEAIKGLYPPGKD